MTRRREDRVAQGGKTYSRIGSDQSIEQYTLFIIFYKNEKEKKHSQIDKGI